LLLAVGFFGCGRQLQPRHVIILVDVSASIDRKALGQAFKAIDELAGNLRRGDKFAIIPILGDAQAEASGRIIRFEVPTNRQAYDSDLRSFRKELKASLKDMEAFAVTRPGTRTDILGSVTLAEQEFEGDPRESKWQLIILSDFIQEDHEIDFEKDRSLANRAVAKDFVARFVKAKSIGFNGISVYLGPLRSREYASLSRTRREGIQEFWINYFTSLNAVPEFAGDGLGLLKKTVSAK
jgi:hypothetical protein